MMRRTAVACAYSLVLLMINTSAWAQQAPLPAVVDISLPDGGGTFHIALPPDHCAYPKVMRDRLSEFLAGGTPSFKLLGIAGNCANIAELLRGQDVIVSPSLQLTMFTSEIDPQNRSKPEAYRRKCFEEFPDKGNGSIAKDLQKSLGELSDKPLDANAASLGLLASTRDAVFGGMIQEVSDGNRRIRQIQIVACFAPGNVPVFWIFQKRADENWSAEEFTNQLRALLAITRTQVQLTADLNRQK